MKRDIELVKQILLYFEAKTSWEGEEQVVIEGFDKEVLRQVQQRLI